MKLDINSTTFWRQCAVTLLVLLFYVGGVFIFKFLVKKQNQESQALVSSKEINIETSGKVFTPEESWRYSQNKKLSEVTQKIEELKSALEAKEQEFEEKLNSQKEELLAQQAEQAAHFNFNDKGSDSNIDPFNQNSMDSNTKPSRSMGVFVVPLKPKGKKTKKLKTVDTHIPAGSFAQARLVSGVDASTAVSSSSDPRPVFLRIIDYGNLPRKFKTDVKDCHCLASSYGDLASERVFMRLEKITCVERKTGEILEKTVSGYVTGSDGRAGVRGVVVSREGSMLANSFMSGFASGLSQVLTPLASLPQSPISAMTQPYGSGPTSKDRFNQALGQGGTNALDRLSQYYINRAEQLQPVIQIQSGTKIDVIFTEGIKLDDTAMQEAVSSAHDKERFQTIKEAGGNFSAFNEPTENNAA